MKAEKTGTENKAGSAKQKDEEETQSGMLHCKSAAIALALMVFLLEAYKKCALGAVKNQRAGGALRRPADASLRRW